MTVIAYELSAYTCVHTLYAYSDADKYTHSALSAVSPSLTYTGSGYAHYTLTEQGSGEMRSTYQDIVSLTLRTVESEAVFFSMQDKSGSEYLHIQVIPALYV